MKKYTILINHNSASNLMFNIVFGCLDIKNACRFKNLLIFMLFFAGKFLINPVFSQSEPKLYFGVGPAIPSKSVGLSFTCIFGNNWGLSMSTKGFDLDAINLPNDYVRGGGGTYNGIFGIPQTSKPNEYPNDHLSMLSYMALREFEIGAHRLRFGLEAGPCSITYSKADFTPKPNSKPGENNYTVDYRKRYTAGFSLRAKVEIPYWRCLGMEVAVLGNINKYQSFAGAELYFTIGRVRAKIPPANVQNTTTNDHH